MAPWHADTIRSLVARGIDWALVMRLSIAHGLLPLVCWNLERACPDIVPEETRSQLRRQFDRTTERNTRLAHQLMDLFALFERHHLPVIAFKGAMVAAEAYEHLSLREFRDLDLLVRDADRDAARALLAEYGFREDHLQGYESTFVGPHDVRVDLHWRLLPEYHGVPLDVDRLWRRLRPIMLEGRPLRTLAPEDAFVVLAAHGAKHAWGQLKWICDISELVRVHRQEDWNRIVTHATAMGTRRLVLLGLGLSASVLGTNLPTEIRRHIAGDATLQRLLPRVQDAVFQGAGTDRQDDVERWRLLLDTRERARDRLGYADHLATSASTRRIRWRFPMSAMLSVIYPLIAPIGRCVGRRSRAQSRR